MGQPSIAVLGDLLYDCFVWAERLPRVGETVTGFENGFFAGGKGGNQAVAAARLGARVAMLGKVGQDERGAFLLVALRDSGVGTEGVLVDPRRQTGTDCVHVDRAGNNAIIVVPQANEHIAADEVMKHKKLIERADVLLVQLQVNVEAVAAALAVARAAGVATVLNPAPAREVPEGLFALADYLTPNETEAEFYAGLYRDGMDHEAWRAAAAERIRRRGARRVVITLGEMGAYFCGPEGAFTAPPFPVEAVDTTAAGDAFNAAFAIQVALGADVQRAVRRGNAAGALAAAYRGSQPSLPTGAALTRFLQLHCEE